MNFLIVKTKYPESKGFRLYRKNIGNMYIFIHFLTPVNAVLKNELVKIKPGGCVFFSPNSSQEFSSPDCNLLHDWFHADITCGDLMNKYKLECNTVYYPDMKKISSIMTQIEYEYIHKKEYYTEALSSLSENLFIELARAETNPDYVSYIDKQQRELFINARTKIHNDFKKQWTIEEMAELVHLSESRFYSLYKKIFGVSPHQDLMKLRIHNAQVLLIRENISVEQCATLMGFTNQYHFIRQFKKITGTTPGKLKR